MKTYLRITFSLMFLLRFSSQSFAQDDSHPTTMRLNEALVSVAQTKQIAVQAEVVLPMPVVSISSAELQDEAQLAAALHKQLPEYSVQLHAGILFVGNRTFMRSPRNPMNASLKSFRMPSTLDDLARTLPNRSKKAMSGDKAAGGLTNGLGSLDVGPSLKPEVLANTTARNVISRVAAEVQPFVSIFVAPATYRTSATAQQDSMWRDWEMIGGNHVMNYKSHCCNGDHCKTA